jgi:hypothetical protein
VPARGAERLGRLRQRKSWGARPEPRLLAQSFRARSGACAGIPAALSAFVDRSAGRKAH